MKVAAYCRVSTDKEDQANSLESQLRYFKDYIDGQPEWELYKIFADEGITGTSTKKRTAFNHMITEAKLGLFDRIITKEVSRFSRNILDTISFTRELKRLGVGVIFMNDGINTFDPDAELRLSIMGSIAQEESRKTSSRVKWGQTRRMEQGVVFGRSMLGYNVKNGKMTINPEGAEIVRQIYYKYVTERKGTSVIARELREAGYRTITGNVNWTNAVILKVLRNEKYCGDLCQKKTYTPDYLTHVKKYNRGQEKMIYIKDHHEPIIERELWNAAQLELKRRNVKSVVKEGHGSRYPLSGKIKCGYCGASFVARRKTRNNGTKYKTWRCFTASTHGRRKIDAAGNEIGCNIGRQLRDELAMDIVRQCMEELSMERNKVIANIVEMVMEVIRENESGEQSDLKRNEIQLSTVTEKKKKALDAFFAQSITKDEMRMMNEKYDAEITELTEKINAIRKRRKSSRYTASVENEVKQKVEDVIAGKTDIEIFCSNLLKRITVYADNTVDVEFNFLPTKWKYII